MSKKRHLLRLPATKILFSKKPAPRSRPAKTPEVDYVDPFELLNEAKAIMEQFEGPEFEDWLARFDRLPGATLTPTQVHLLQCSAMRCAHHEKDLEKLWGAGLFKEVEISAGYGHTFHSVRHRRINATAHDALRLRKGVVDCKGHG